MSTFSIDIQKLINQFGYQPDEPLLFNSGLFLLLFVGFLLIYIPLSSSHRPKLIFTTIFSLYFYYKSSGLFFLLLISTTCIDYALAKLIYDHRTPWKRSALLTISLLSNLGLLGYFKYTNFLHEIFSNLSGLPYQPFDIFLPVGVSFFTFQSLSYTIDVYRKQLKPADHIIDYAFFVSFFPQLVAGPIVRASEFLPQLAKPTLVTKEMFGKGIYLITAGLFKKAVISVSIFVGRPVMSIVSHTNVTASFLPTDVTIGNNTKQQEERRSNHCCERPFAFAACLAARDDNVLLPEWLACHCTVLPLRHLVVAADPLSITSPESILNDFSASTNVEIEFWKGNHCFCDGQWSRERFKNLDPLNHTGHNGCIFHLQQQKAFCTRCLQRLKSLPNVSLALIVDSDEHLTHNAIRSPIGDR